jgi:hypothetical protein
LVRSRPGLRALAVWAYGLLLLLPFTFPFAAVALPALVGEGLSSRWLRRWPRVAVLCGGLVACAVVALYALLVSVCGLGDQPNPVCDRLPDLLHPFGAITLGLTALACAWPNGPARYALWATPAAMMATLVAFAL